MSILPSDAPLAVTGDLADGLRQLGLDVEACVRPLQAYARLLRRYNSRYRLVADLQQLTTHHLLDSLAGLETVRSLAVAGRLVDIGSGAGLPGVPLALAAPELQVTLVERSARRAMFLRLVVSELRLGNRCRVLEQSLERLGCQDAAPDNDLLVSRAVAGLGETVTMLRALAAREVCVDPRASLIAYKGRASVVARETREVAQGCRVLPLQVPGVAEERHLVVVAGPWQ